MATKPTTVPRWARTAGGADAANIATPTSGESDTGYTNGQAVVSSSKTNWLFNWIYKWILYLQDAVFVATSGSGLAGVDATGDGASPGVKATPGGGGTPARGALSLAVQAAPSAPANGDFWATAAALFLRIAGSTFTVALLEASQIFTGTITFNPGAAGSVTFNSSGVGAAVVANGGTTGPGVLATGGGSSGGGPGIKGVGGTSFNPGGMFQPSSTSTPGVGNINLVPLTATPSAPVNGDMWVENVGGTWHLKVRMNGITSTIV